MGQPLRTTRLPEKSIQRRAIHLFEGESGNDRPASTLEVVNHPLHHQWRS